MPAIVRLERLLRVCRVRVAVLCVLFGLCVFMPFVGAAPSETTYKLEGLAIGAVTTVPGMAEGVLGDTMVDPFLVTTVLPDGEAMRMAAAGPQDNEDKQKDDKSPQLATAPQPAKGGKPKPSPVQ